MNLSKKELFILIDALDEFYILGRPGFLGPKTRDECMVLHDKLRYEFERRFNVKPEDSDVRGID